MKRYNKGPWTKESKITKNVVGFSFPVKAEEDAILATSTSEDLGPKRVTSLKKI